MIRRALTKATPGRGKRMAGNFENGPNLEILPLKTNTRMSQEVRING